MIKLFLIHLVFSAVCSFHFSPKTFTRSVARPLHSKGESLSDDEIHSSLKWQSALSSLRDRVSSIKSGVPAGASSLYSLMTEVSERSDRAFWSSSKRAFSHTRIITYSHTLILSYSHNRGEVRKMASVGWLHPQLTHPIRLAPSFALLFFSLRRTHPHP